MLYLITYFIYGYMASDILKRAIQIVREETRCSHMGYSFLISSKILLYASSNRQNSTYHGICYTSRGNSSMGPPSKFKTKIMQLIILLTMARFPVQVLQMYRSSKFSKNIMRSFIEYFFLV